MGIQEKMIKELEQRKAFINAKEAAFQYMDTIDDHEIYPSEEDIESLKLFHEPLNQHPSPAHEIVDMLVSIGTKGTIAQTG